jgi:ABC-type branched-subunit amino acid transport system substrate-binding protein
VQRFVAIFVSGLNDGSIYALVALGITLLQNATGVINFAQGDLMTLGAYVGFWFVVKEHGSQMLVYPVTLVALFAAGVVVISNTLDQIVSDKSLGSDLYFRMSLTTSQFATAADDYLFQKEGVKKLMVINTDDAAPTDGASYILADAKSRGISTQHQAVAVTATDLTEQVLAAKSSGAGAIWEWGYPTTDGLLIKTAAANGYNGDIMTFSAESAAASGLIPKSLLTNHVLSVPVNCAPEVLNTSGAQAYDSAYAAKYGKPPTSAIANEDYDAVELYKLAVEKAGTTTSKAVGSAMGTVSYNGACGLDQSDSFHNFEHSISLLNFPGGTEALADEVTNVPAQW